MATSNMDIVKNVNKAMRSVSKGEDMKEDMALLMAPNASWEHFLVPAPISIALLGELMLISTDTDFSLSKKPPKDGFQLLKWPDSFRACLAQVGHSGWDAFNEAHKNMDQIRLYTSNVPTHLKQAVQILLKGSNEELEEMLPIPMGNIKMTANKCLKLATSVEDKFIHVMKLTAELLEACTNARGQYESDLRDTNIALAVARQHEEAVQKERSMAEEQYKDLKNHVQDAEKQFKESMNSLPSGWEMIGMSVVESLGNALKSFVSSKSSQGSKGKKQDQQGNATPLSKEDQKKEEASRKVYNHVDLLKVKLAPLVTFLIGKDGKLKTEKLMKCEKVKYFKAETSQTKKYISNEKENLVKKLALELCERAITICDGLECISKQMSHDPSEIDEIANNLLELEREVSELAEQGKLLYSTNPLDSKSPNEAVWSPGEDADESIVKQTVDNARFKIEHASGHLKHTQDKYDSACDKLKESSQKLGNILADMAKLEIQEINHEKIKEMLIKGIRALGEVREQWGKLVLFFQMMSNLIECSLNTTLQNFLQYANSAQQRTLNGFSISSFAKDMIYQEAFEAAKIAHLVTMISGSYVEVSGKYLVHRVASLGKLLGYDAEKDKDEIKRERQKLHAGCQEAQKGIEELVMQRKLEFDQQVQKRMMKIKRELEAVLPPASPEKKRKIEEVVKASIAKVLKPSKMATSNMDIVKNVKLAMRGVSKIEEMKEDMALLMTLNASWERFLIPAPIWIALLGELMLISADTDFSLAKKPPKDGFQLLKWPDSFRACLAQVWHSGWYAFNEAHKNMDQIRLFTTNVQTHLLAVQILLKRSDEELEELLPIPLGNIKMTTDKCRKLATSVEDKFVHVMNLTAELLEACTNAVRDANIALAVARRNEEAFEMEKRIAEYQYKELKNHVQDAEKQFKKSMNSLPSGWEMIGMSVVESLGNSLKSFVSSKSSQGSKGKKQDKQGNATPMSKEDQQKEEATRKVYNHVDLLKVNLAPFVTILIGKDGKLKTEKLMKCEEVKYFRAETSQRKKYISNEKENLVKKLALELCERAITICDGLEGISKQMSHDPSEIDEIANNLLELEREVSELAEQGNRGNCYTQPTHCARFKIEHASAHLKLCDKLKKNNLKLGNILADIAKLDIQKIFFEKIKKTLIKGIKVLGEVREQWSKLVLLFQMENFLQYADKAQQRTLNGYSISRFSKDMIYQEAFEAAKIAHLVTMISGSYVEVSGKYLVHRVVSLSKLLGYHAEKDKDEIKRERLKLHAGCQEAQKGIEELVMQRKLEFDQQVQKRMMKVKRELESVLPPASPEEKMKIEEVAKASISKVKEVEAPTATLDADDFA